MAEIKLSSPKVRVVLGNDDDPGSWAQREVQTIMKDVVMAESELARTKRGPASDHPLLALVVACYYALRRTGQGSGSLKDFEEHCIDIEVITDEDLDPTQPATEAG